jgi:hypothetical protein
VITGRKHPRNKKNEWSDHDFALKKINKKYPGSSKRWMQKGVNGEFLLSSVFTLLLPLKKNS